MCAKCPTACARGVGQKGHFSQTCTIMHTMVAPQQPPHPPTQQQVHSPSHKPTAAKPRSYLQNTLTPHNTTDYRAGDERRRASVYK